MRCYQRKVHCLKISQGYASNFIRVFRCYVLPVIQISNNTVQYRKFEIVVLSARNFSRFFAFFLRSLRPIIKPCFAAKKATFAYHYELRLAALIEEI